MPLQIYWKGGSRRYNNIFVCEKTRLNKNHIIEKRKNLDKKKGLSIIFPYPKGKESNQIS
jgi:hypothetical protein